VTTRDSQPPPVVSRTITGGEPRPEASRTVAEVIANDVFVRETLKTLGVRLHEINANIVESNHLVRDMREQQPVQMMMLDCLRDLRDELKLLRIVAEQNRDALIEVLGGRPANGHT